MSVPYEETTYRLILIHDQLLIININDKESPYQLVLFFLNHNASYTRVFTLSSQPFIFIFTFEILLYYIYWNIIYNNEIKDIFYLCANVLLLSWCLQLGAKLSGVMKDDLTCKTERKKLKLWNAEMIKSMTESLHIIKNNRNDNVFLWHNFYGLFPM